MNANRNIPLVYSRRVFLYLLFAFLGSTNALGQYINQTFEPTGSSASFATSMVCYDDTCIIHGFKRDLASQIPYNSLLKVTAGGNFFGEHYYTITNEEVRPQHKTIIKKGDFLYLALSAKINEDTSFSCLYKCTLAGDTVWTKRYGASTGQLIVYSLIEHPDSGFVLFGVVEEAGPVQNISDIFILRTDNLGNESWRKTYGLPGRSEEPASLLPLANEEYIVGGYANVYPPNYPDDERYSKGMLVKFRNNGTTLAKEMGRPLNTEWIPGWLLRQPSGEIMVSSYLSDDLPNSDLRKGMVFNIDTGLNIVFEKLIEPDFASLGFGKVLELDEGYLFLGSKMEANLTQKTTLTQTDKPGNIIWQRQYYYGGINSINVLSDMALLPNNGGFALAGQVQVFPDQSIWFVRTDQYGCLVPDCHLADVPEHPSTPLSISLYPNPATDFLYVYNPYSEDALGALVDMNGRTVMDGLRVPAQTTTIVPMYDLPQGIYVLRIPLLQGSMYTEKIIKQ